MSPSASPAPSLTPVPLAIQSWCFRGFKDHAAVMANLKATGVSALEISAFHLDPVKPEPYADVLAMYKNAGVSFTAFGVQWFDADEAKVRKSFEFAKTAGIPFIACDFDAEGLKVCEKLTAEYGIKVGIHNHGKRHRHGSPWVLEEIFAKTSPNIGLCLDTAWMLDQGFDPVEIAAKFRSRLYGLHIKDFVFNRAGKYEDVVVGTGNLNLAALAKLLLDTQWTGSLTLEYEGDVQNPVPALSECVKAIHKAFAAAR